MSIYSVKTKKMVLKGGVHKKERVVGYRYEFIVRGSRYTSKVFKTKTEAREGEEKYRREIREEAAQEQVKTDTDLLTLLNRRLDHIKMFNTKHYYDDNRYLFRRIARRWEAMRCSEISRAMIQDYIDERMRSEEQPKKARAHSDLRLLKALFNFGIEQDLITDNPAGRVKCPRPERGERRIPTIEEILKVLNVANNDTREYLLTFLYTLGRMSEINRLTWSDVNLEEDGYIVLRTRKKRGGVLTPRRIPLAGVLKEILAKRYEMRDPTKPWVFWHRFWSQKDKCFIEGPYSHRSEIMRSLCEKAGVAYFRYHAIRHAGASLLDQCSGIGETQKILGHESRHTTEIYLHTIYDQTRNAMRKFEEKIAGVPHESTH